MQKYTAKCCRCGFCCLSETCPIGQSYYGVARHTRCPGVYFNGQLATCSIVHLIPTGDGCCIKATAYKDGIAYDFATLPPHLKRHAATKKREVSK